MMYGIKNKRKIIKIHNLKKFLNTDEREQWVAAINSELQTLIRNGTFAEKVVSKRELKNLNLILTLWRLNKKLKLDGIKFKARLCARGDQEKDGDFEIYAPTLAADI